MACRKNLGALLHIFASRAGIGPCFERTSNLKPAGFYPNIFLQHHRIGTTRQSRACEYAQGLAGQEPPFKGLSSSSAPVPQLQTLRTRLQTASEGIAIHR
jgi:hypothetical protein